MATIEIERRFLPAVPPPVDASSGEHIRQGYLAGEGSVSVRMRITDREMTLTVKAGPGMARTEVDVAIDADQATALWPHTEGRRIDKHRYRVAVGDTVADVDCYHGALEGLWTIEVEFPDTAAARAFTPPDWFGREVTGRPGWSNAALARHGLPPDS